MKKATFKLVLHAKVLKSGQQSIALRVTFDRSARFFFLHIYCAAAEWDKSACRLTRAYAGHKRANELLRMYEQRAADALYQFERDGIAFSFNRFERAVFPDQHTGGATRFADWLEVIERENRDKGSPGNAHFYKEAARAIRHFRPTSTLSDVDARYLASFERWAAVNRNLSPGGLLALLRNIRAGCNRAVADGLMPKEWNPFPAYTLSHLKPRKAKKGAPLEFFKALERLSQTPDLMDPAQAFALDLFLFSFYTRGTNLVDIADLTARNIEGGRIVYIRRKTKREYSMRLNEKAAAIIRKYRGGALLFPVYSKAGLSPAEKKREMDNYSRVANQRVRQCAALIGWKVAGLTFYTARHSYADILKGAGVSVEVISQALGHSDIRVTDAYLKGFGDRVLDDADAVILN